MSAFFKFIGVFFLSTFASGLIHAQENQQALLWKIDGKNLNKASYLFGTIHLIPKEDYFLPYGLENVFDSVKKVYFEIDLNQMNDLGEMMGLMDKIMMKNDTSLADLLSTEEYAKMEKYFEGIGMPLAMFDRIKPMFLSALADTDSNPNALKDGSFKSYEFELSDLAKKKELETGGLESIEFQLSIFDSIPYKVQANMLLQSIASTGNNEHQTKQMYKDYKNQNLNALNEAISSEDTQFVPYLEMLLYNRNKSWIPTITTAMHTSPCLFAVGAGHLIGDRGVIQLLRNQGYSVTPVLEKK
jgi:uncharacterized protein YbaP (TraB family)